MILLSSLFVFKVYVDEKDIKVVFLEHVEKFFDFERIRPIGVEFDKNADYQTA